MKKGFTLIEVLAVIVILAIVLILTIPKVLDALETARLNAFKSDLVGIYKTLEKQIYEAGLDLNDRLQDSNHIYEGAVGGEQYIRYNFQRECPSRYWSDSKALCKYSYNYFEGVESLLVRVDWEFDGPNAEFGFIDALVYNGVNFIPVAISE